MLFFSLKQKSLGRSLHLNGSIVWKEEINEDLTEYGIKFIIEKEEQDFTF